MVSDDEDVTLSEYSMALDQDTLPFSDSPGNVFGVSIDFDKDASFEDANITTDCSGDYSYSISNDRCECDLVDTDTANFCASGETYNAGSGSGTGTAGCEDSYGTLTVVPNCDLAGSSYSWDDTNLVCTACSSYQTDTYDSSIADSEYYYYAATRSDIVGYNITDAEVGGIKIDLSELDYIDASGGFDEDPGYIFPAVFYSTSDGVNDTKVGIGISKNMITDYDYTLSLERLILQLIS